MRQNFDLKQYLLNTIGSSYLILNASKSYICFSKDEIKDICHLVKS